MCNSLPATMRHLLLFISLLAMSSLYGHTTIKMHSTNLTGTYEYDGKTYLKDGDRYGYFGTIKIKELSKSVIQISFFICKGAPSYNVGEFLDTLVLTGSKAVYRPSCDRNCTIEFAFLKSSVKSVHKDADGDFNYSCCFGMAVIADGYFKKISSRVPIKMKPDFE